MTDIENLPNRKAQFKLMSLIYSCLIMNKKEYSLQEIRKNSEPLVTKEEVAYILALLKLHNWIVKKGSKYRFLIEFDKKYYKKSNLL
ncbi:hypothetical protein HY745_13370 [Candidatus Desantisbacteria bacterium]|nr:hypothetical protein [Candidatus Desantisbacteria bacterium]